MIALIKTNKMFCLSDAVDNSFVNVDNTFTMHDQVKKINLFLSGPGISHTIRKKRQRYLAISFCIQLVLTETQKSGQLDNISVT